jgi:hypothetical protein
MPSMQSNSRPIDLPLLLGVAALAWWPLLIERPVVADDFFNGAIVGEGLGTYWHKYGIWRILGHPIPFLLREAIPFADRALAFATHLVTLLLFHLSLRRLVIPRPINLAGSLLLAVIPFGFQALTWNSALTFALSTVFCLGAFLVLLRPVENFARAIAIGVCGGALGFLSLSANEATILLLPWLALYPVMRVRRGNDHAAASRTSWRPALLTTLIILAFEVAWVGLHLATKGDGFHKNPAFHAAAIVSGLFRQTSQATYLTHLPKLGEWLPAASWWSALGACGVMVLLLLKVKPSESRRPQWIAGLYFAILPIMAVAIYALGGGFSTDSRKAYVIWPFLLITAAFFLQAVPSRIQAAALVVAVMFCPVFLLATHATTRIWSQTGTLFESAYRKIRDENMAGPYQFAWQPDVYAVWPGFDTVCGFRFDTPWVVETAAGVRPQRTDSMPATLTFNRGRMIWDVQRDKTGDAR